MASLNDISVNDKVSIDKKGLGIVTDIVYRGFDNFYMVKLLDVDFEVELPRERLTVVREYASRQDTGRQQTTEPTGSNRFNIASESQVDEFNFQQTNRKTLIKTASDLKILREFFNQPEINETRLIHEIPVPELSSLLCRFLVSVKKRNGDDYEPSCLRGMLCSFDRQLRRQNYVESIANGHGFAKVRETLKMKQRQLKSDGKGNLPNKKDPISSDDIEQLWKADQLGTSTPDSILQTLWLYTTIHFGLRGCQEHRDMCWGDVTLKHDGDGREFLEFSERQTKTRTGDNPRDIRTVKPKLWANVNNPDRCPIRIYKLYAEKRPTGFSEPSSPFYVAATTIHHPSPQETWFKRNPIGVNKISSMMKRMVERAGLNPDKKLSNHSARKHLVQKLNDFNVPANQIMQISGHKNIHSINNYSHINEVQHRHISEILHSDAPSSTVQETQPRVGLQSQSFLHSSKTASNSSLHVSGGFQSIFGAQIHGGTFNVHIHQHSDSAENIPPARKRLRILDSDSDTE